MVLALLAMLVVFGIVAWQGWQRGWFGNAGTATGQKKGAAVSPGVQPGAPRGRPGAGPGGGAGGGPAGAPGGAPGSEERAMPVLVAPVLRETLELVADALGTVTARSTVTVRSRVEGPLQSVEFREGQKVEKGQVLARIDPRPFEVALMQAKGQLARDRAQLNNARIDLQRYQDLLRKDSIARQQVDTQAALVRQFEGALLTDQAQVDSAQLQLDYTKITAPVAGRVGLRQVDPGNVVRPADTNGIVVINEVQPIMVVFSLPADRIPEIAKAMSSGQQPVTEAWDRSGDLKLATGRLVSLDNQIDTSTGTIRLKAEFDNADGALFPNQFVNVKLQVRAIADAITVPDTAIQRGSRGSFVYVIREGRARLSDVRIATRAGDRVALETGAAPGEIVVINGADRLKDGMKVDAIESRTKAAAPGSGARP